ncbi:MAG: DUF1559 domain-containing protein [Pirellulales bacterium]|nr:DUF1559 domain-containing protein [Pirellulales bacterium]
MPPRPAHQPGCAPAPGRAFPTATPPRGVIRAAVRAFTLVELMVVIAIIGLLVALLFAGLQAARSAAHKTRCGNNLRQIGLALVAYHDAHKQFPPGGIEWRSKPTDNDRRQHAWSALVLPFLEETPLYRRIDFELPFDHPDNAPAAMTVVPVYLCPASLRGEPLARGRGACDYGGIYGERISRPNDPPRGILIYDQAFRARQITDGLSHTIIVGEDSQFTDGQWINGRNIFDQAFAINAAPPFENDIRSGHPRGAQVVLADASVHFLREELSLRTLAALCTRAEGDHVGEY